MGSFKPLALLLLCFWLLVLVLLSARLVTVQPEESAATACSEIAGTC